MNRVSEAMKGRKALIAGVGLGVVALTLATGMSTAGARTMSKAAPAVSHVISNALPAGFNVVTSAPITALNGVQTHGVAVCPGATKPLGGGVFVASTSTLASVNSSNPLGKRDWSADVNNASGADTSMQVYAVCANRGAANFTVNSQNFVAGPDAQTSGAVSCPAGVVVGGGVYSATGNTSNNINSNFPNSTMSWRADMNNGNNIAENFTVYAICRNTKPKGYSLQIGAAVSNPAGAQTGASATCPGASVALSGGVLSGSGSTSVNLNETLTNGAHVWTSYENNASGLDTTITPYAICAGK